MFTKKLKKKLLFISLVVLIIFRFFATQPHYLDGQNLRITARVFQEPIRYSFKQSLNLLGLKIYLPLYPEISYGDRVIVEGEVKGGELINAKLISVTENKNWLYSLREKIINFYRSVLPEPHASLVAGIVLGSKSQIPADFWQSLKNSGLAHVVVASGMNVTFVASFLMSFLAVFLPRRRFLLPAFAGIWLYALLAGLDAPIVRAAVMGSLAFLAQRLGKVAAAWRILLISAVGMLLVKPLWLTDLGFYLSFVATGSLILFEKPIRERLAAIPTFFREGLATSLAAQIGVAPILFVTFGQFNIWSPFLNALVLWTVPPVMIIGAIGGLVGLVLPQLGKLLLYLVYPLTWWFVTIGRL